MDSGGDKLDQIDAAMRQIVARVAKDESTAGAVVIAVLLGMMLVVAPTLLARF
jgi:hypothetical protein